jgi:mono/diheme cytochrome c family protein
MDKLTDIHAKIQNDTVIKRSFGSKLTSIFKGLALGLSVGASALVFAEAAKPEPGEADFMSYCASCHGVTGEGNGPVAGSLKNRPPDLTYLHQQETDGAFPYKRVLSIIEGNPDHDKNIRTHGPADMPVWGKVIYEDSGEQEAVTRARLRALTNYVKSIQK